MAGQISPEPFPLIFPLSPAREDFAKIPNHTSSNQHCHPCKPTRSHHHCHSIAILQSTSSHHDCHPSLYLPTHNLLLCMSVFWLFISVTGGIENIGCTKKDIYNHESKVQNELRGQDAELLKEYFLTEQEKDPCFFFKIDVDDDGKLKRCFWADSVSRRAYGCFGDVVVFDTTYNTNQYGMIFAPLVRVNNHDQTVLFACAFLSDEKTESIVWLFELLKDSMPMNNPKMIITDQDPAMTKAIVQSLPNTFHRYCSWHILEKFSAYLNAITYRDFYKDFQQCIWESECSEEFERKWVTTIEKASLDNNDRLKSIFELRSRWVPAVLAHQRHKELGADHVDINEKLVLKLPLEMQKQMAEIYTH
ncbi:protein FAR1-RELATED SEQUENCE 5-like [Ziziphus jujuba]|uniref:Protein FAR1-RELATED SEQUENCE 5-like n=1 Tax=Ziziphus jujuba TaxID=326968 RepID=A0ABM4A3R7_ZIZJJ|nr:protein FAR1-RELATED SEQUENCE 5-like [Ziziphus jujuba]